MSKVANKLTLTVKRPNGKIEKVAHPKLKWINEAQFKQIQAGTLAAGRGQVLSYEIEYVEKPDFKRPAKSIHELAHDDSNEKSIVDAMTLGGTSN